MKEGQIESSEYQDLRKAIDRKIIDLDTFKFEYEIPTFSSFVLKFPIFKKLNREQINFLLASSKEIKLKNDEYFYKAGQKVDMVYVVVKGNNPFSPVIPHVSRRCSGLDHTGLRDPPCHWLNHVLREPPVPK